MLVYPFFIYNIFFTIDNLDITDVTMQLNDFSKYPLSIYSISLKFIFTFIIPIGFTAYYPSLIIIEGPTKDNILLVIGTILFGIGFLY